MIFVPLVRLCRAIPAPKCCLSPETTVATLVPSSVRNFSNWSRDIWMRGVAPAAQRTNTGASCSGRLSTLTNPGLPRPNGIRSTHSTLRVTLSKKRDSASEVFKYVPAIGVMSTITLRCFRNSSIRYA